jgi:hypothetical protein
MGTKTWVGLGVLVLSLAPAAAAQPGFSAGVDANGTLVATMRTDSGTVAFRYDKSVACPDTELPCYSLVAISGTETTPVAVGSGCVADPNQPGAGVLCPAHGIRAVEIDLVNGGTIGLGTDNGGQHAGDCAPVPVKIVAHAGSSTFNVGTWDGCNESVHCDGAGQVTADRSDDVHGCEFVERH